MGSYWTTRYQRRVVGRWIGVKAGRSNAQLNTLEVTLNRDNVEFVQYLEKMYKFLDKLDKFLKILNTYLEILDKYKVKAVRLRTIRVRSR